MSLLTLNIGTFFLGGAVVASDLLSDLTAAEIAITGATTATISRMHVCSGTTADYTVTLPAVSGNTGKLIGFRMAPGLTKLVTLDGNASELIDGELTRVLWKNETALLLCDGSAWTKIAGKTIPMGCIMRRNADQTAVVTGTLTKVLLNATDSDSTGLMADTTNSRINILRPSNYLTVGNVVWNQLSAASTRAITQVTKNAGIVVIGNAEAYGPINGFPSIISPTPAPLVAGDYVELRALQDSGANQIIYGAASPTAATNLAVLENPIW